MESNKNQPDLDMFMSMVTEALKPMLTEFVKQSAETQQTPAPEETEENPVIENGHDKSCSEISEKVNLLLEKVEFLLEDDKKFNKMHAELDEHRKGLYRKITSPVLKSIVYQYSRVNDIYNFYDKKRKEENADKALIFDDLLREYKNLQLGLSDLLYDYDIEIVEPEAGEEFNPKMHKAIKTIPTDDAGKERKIAACVAIGFKDVSANDQIVKYPEVEIFKLNQ